MMKVNFKGVGAVSNDIYGFIVTGTFKRILFFNIAARIQKRDSVDRHRGFSKTDKYLTPMLRL